MPGLLIGIMILTNTTVFCVLLLLNNRYRRLRKQYQCIHFKIISINQELDIARFTIRKLVDREIKDDEKLNNIRHSPTDFGKSAWIEVARETQTFERHQPASTPLIS